MSQQPPKKSGSRDINDLKARLGLKKGTTPSPIGTKTGGSPAMVAPPGLAVPPPPGVAGPAPVGPPQPVVPNAAEDPFGAMNAMAQIGAAQRAPEIVIVNDGKPVESVSASARGATIAKYVAIALVPFILGIAIRGVSKDAGFYNAGIRDSRFILKDVKAVKKSLVTLNEAVTKAKDNQGKDVTNAMVAVDKVELQEALIFKAKQNNLGADLSSKILQFYASVTQLKLMINDHLRTAKSDDQALGAAREATEKAKMPPNSGFEKAVGVRYAVLVSNPGPDDPAGGEFGAKLVEVGPPFCQGDTKPSTNGTCPDGAVETLAYRVNASGSWQRGDFAIPGQNLDPGAPIPSKKLLVMAPTQILEGLVQGPDGFASLALYAKRVDAIRKKLQEVIEAGNDLEGVLGPKANESEKFTFFM
ncbi:MAG: hypothetical protein IPL61_16980 [Myxococcales bacterium]|nr:hypothetical protein [Myxococcales bacterium]